MSRQIWKPGNMLYPLPAVMVSTADKEGNSNIITIAWTGTVCTNPAMVYISVRPERYSYHMIKESGEFVINLTTEKLTKATDYCGVRSGENMDDNGKFMLNNTGLIAYSHGEYLSLGEKLGQFGYSVRKKKKQTKKKSGMK